MDEIEKEYVKQIGKHIRGHRQRLNLTIAELAEPSGLDPTHLGKIERGKTHPGMVTVAKIATGLKLPDPHLLFMESKEKYYPIPIKLLY
ncbi:helix-turn-helix domain-containing protein [Rossellomorea vietnamensis]|uniref:Helix-turn-helix domain-containing protein n=1 Tax=Rossellomorea vietnamensis TaxID=218284 RepID=A0A5D4NX57_9BACI|nr:helix-turn-helix transcriptional regulator [Rossellomorea vietnamensis]TYS18479.1 helix-turn-helix domain-containing protein [Rossellomorea vietnamensis]